MSDELLEEFFDELPEELPEELPMLPELERPVLPCMPEEPTDPERRLGSLERSSERPMFLPKFDCESFFDWPRLDEVERLTSPPLVLPTFLLSLSLSRFSMCYLL